MSASPSLPLTHRRRLRELWRSAGWPCRDSVELDLLAAGLLERRFDAAQRETLHLTEAGVQALATLLAKNRAAFDAHEALVGRVAEAMQRAGRIVWRGLSLRAPLVPLVPVVPVAPVAPVAPVVPVAPLAPIAPPDPHAPVASANPSTHPGEEGDGPAASERSGSAPAPPSAVAPAPARVRWVMAMPDVYSIRHTTVETFTEPVVHEIKVRRADLLADLRRPDKGAAYRALSSQCWYVLGPGVGSEADVPPEYGVLVATATGLELARPAPRRPVTPDFSVWMALARASALPPPEDAPQAPLGADEAP